MKTKIKMHFKKGWILLSVLLVLVVIASTGTAAEYTQPEPASPFGEKGHAAESTGVDIGINALRSMDAVAASSVIQDGADRLAALQNNDGGFDWPLDDGNPATGSALNTVAPIGKGLAFAYLNTIDPAHLAALEDAGSYLLTKTNNFVPPDGYLAAQLDAIYGNSQTDPTSYSYHVKTNFYDKLDAGTYNKDGAGTPYTTLDFIDWYRNTKRASTPNLGAWDIGMGLVGAASVGAITDDWIDQTKDAINDLDASPGECCDIIGLSGAVHGLAYVGENFDPMAGMYAAASSLDDLADTLASYQLSSGGFKLDLDPGDDIESVQTTAYTILALNAADRIGYQTELNDGVVYLNNVQLPTGGWEDLVGDGENNEVTAEALWAIGSQAMPFILGGNRLAALQNNDGGWDWPLTDGNPSSTSQLNTLGPIAKGLALAYLRTEDPAQQAALQNAGALLLTKTNNFSPSDGYLAAQLDAIFGGTTYVDHVQANFYAPLAAGNYNRNGAGILYNTADYVNLIRTARAGLGNIAAWDIGMGLVSAAAAGADTTEWIAGTKAEIDEFDDSAGYNVIGLAGAVFGLAYDGEDFDPTAGDLAAASSLDDLADILASYQINGGGFTWDLNNVAPGYEGLQTTAYAVLALIEVDPLGYQTEIAGAVDYMIDLLQPNGVFEQDSYENNEITGEALWAIASMPSIIEPTITNSILCGAGAQTVTISLNNVVGLYGYQFTVTGWDATTATADNEQFIDGFFTHPTGPTPEVKSKSCDATSCSFYATRVNPSLPVSGNGPVASFDLTAVAGSGGVFDLTFSYMVLSNLEGFEIPYEISEPPLEITVCGQTVVDGYVKLQGRLQPGSHFAPGTVTLVNTDATAYGPYSTTFDQTTGYFSISNVDALPGGSAYTLQAEHDLYLGNELMTTLTPASYTAPNTKLLGGDADLQDDVTITDISCIASKFGPGSDTCGSAGDSNINGDSVTNIQDLSIAGGNYFKSSFLDW